MTGKWHSDVLTNIQQPTFFAASSSTNMSLACVSSRSKMEPRWLGYWAGGVQARMGDVPPPRNFWHYLATTVNPTFKLHRVNAQTSLSPVMPETLACKWRRGLECLSWCLDFETLYFRDKAEEQENGRQNHPVQAETRCLALANSTGPGDSGKKKSAPFGEVVAK